MGKQSIKILIVDDEPGHIHWMSALYKRHGFTVFGALNVEEAREIIKKELPHIVTVEIYMYNGYWFLQEIKKIHKDAVRVVVTTIGDEEYLNFLKEFGFAESCITKPYRDNDVQRLENLITDIASLIGV